MKIIKNNYVVVHRNVVDDALLYAKKYCATYITNSYHMDEYTIYPTGDYFNFYFMDNDQGKKEMTFFALKWT